MGTAEEHRFLLERYQLDSVGWGTPFLLVPEVANVDKQTLQMLSDAKEEDLYLSAISPLGVPFNSLRGNTKDITKQQWIDEGRPGSPCPKKYVMFNTEFTDKPICTASRQYQTMKLRELNTKNLSQAEYDSRYQKITEKSCLCVGLGTPALLVNELDTKAEGPGVSVCPGPNMAYFSGTWSLSNMVDHIYGRINLIKRSDRPHLFIKELKLYLEFFKSKINESAQAADEKQSAYLHDFQQNLNTGIAYYRRLFSECENSFHRKKEYILDELERLEAELQTLALP